MSEQESKRILREFAHRLNEAMDDMKMPPKFQGRQTHAAKLLGVTQKGAGRWLEGRGLPRAVEQPKIAAKVNVRLEWLMFGLGPKRESSNKRELKSNLMQEIILAVDQAVEMVCDKPDKELKARLVIALYRSLTG